MNILFVCTGNTCRSPMAEYLCRNLALKSGISNITVSSAGIQATAGDPIAVEAVAALAREGIVGAGHRAKRLTQAMVDASSLILVMEAHHKEDIESRFKGISSKVRLLSNSVVSDPIGQTQVIYNRTLVQLHQLILPVLEELAK